jgi:formate/nitrite transporter FocA (FNT family)
MSTQPTDRNDRGATNADADAASADPIDVTDSDTASTGAANADAESVSPSTSSETILSRTIEEGFSELERPSDGLFLSALAAGLELGTGLFFMAIVWTYTTGIYAEPTREFVVALAYASGYVFVVLGRTELFTEHTTLAALPVLDGQASLSELGRLWAVVYVGNIVSTAALAGFAVVLGPALGVVKPTAFTGIAKLITVHSPWVLFVGAVFTGWLMGLLAWLVAAAENDGARAFLVVLITFGIGISHLPHPIAGNVKVLMGLFAGSGVSLTFYGIFLATTLVGSVVGGTVFVALLKYGHVVRGESDRDVTPGRS